uniref:Uncharacterized protein n=1 Tax=Alexandrium catenella TaxID=2925 RepID=A0A7S1MG81_ALECA|mmetsp:Transcript_26191/g.71171  ORF Transcript_26191/g.71171 Transcript_26191/m.71171 type:complete len:213 (+) Transcript_26191:325-963(+)
MALAMANPPLQAALKVFVLGVAIRPGGVACGKAGLDVVLNIDVVLAMADGAYQASLECGVLHVPVGTWYFVVCNSTVNVVLRQPKMPPSALQEARRLHAVAAYASSAPHVVGRGDVVSPMADAPLEAIYYVGVPGMDSGVALTNASSDVLIHRVVLLPAADSTRQPILDVIIFRVAVRADPIAHSGSALEVIAEGEMALSVANSTGQTVHKV